MCESGINVSQLRISVAHSEEALGMVQHWLEQLHHLADHADLTDASTEIAQVTVMLGEARAKLLAANDKLEGGGSDKVSVERV